MAFEGVARRVLRELDRSGEQELIMVDSLRNSTTFRPYCLVGRKRPSSWFWRPRYTCLNLSITDILEPGAPEPALQPSGHCKLHFSNSMDVGSKVELDALGQGRIAGGAAVVGSSSVSMEVHTLRVEHGTWEALQQERRLRQPEHKVLQQLRRRRDNLFVVTEVVQTQKEVEITSTQKQEGWGKFALPGAKGLQGEGQGHRSDRKTVTIPAGSTLAFQVAQLVIGSDWEIDFFPDKKQRSFRPPEEARREPPQPTLRVLYESTNTWRGFPSQAEGAAEEGAAFTEDLQGLRAEMVTWSQGLVCLSGVRRQVLRAALGQLLRDAQALEATEAALEQGLRCGRLERQDGPMGAVLECLVLPSREVVQKLAVPVLYLLGALAVLSEGQQLLMAQALDTGALRGPLELVESILEQSEPWQEPRDVSLPPGLLEGGWEEGAPTWALLEACGLRLQRGAPQVCWEPQAQAQVCALYVSLALLAQLNQDPS
ncbi:gasdermin-D-like [Dasypus novemcinctus]|uniref:gasdermin-D-like n=1 Tax=Dasypus novemcinctus TaxID=9361 RepID=UPI00265E223F|nr:gasdermin-D-like [Dasypus novemcinctus]XP_058132109.1 gasdermin-D-like [Dasypus novemcinctus]XP_058132110.1 gasdermin-D-like [Dasypus novemcinctus]